MLIPLPGGSITGVLQYEIRINYIGYSIIQGGHQAEPGHNFVVHRYAHPVSMDLLNTVSLVRRNIKPLPLKGLVHLRLPLRPLKISYLHK